MRRDVQMQVRVTREERDAIAEAAAKCGMTGSEYMRAVALITSGHSPLLKHLLKAK